MTIHYNNDKNQLFMICLTDFTWRSSILTCDRYLRLDNNALLSCRALIMPNSLFAGASSSHIVCQLNLIILALKASALGSIDAEELEMLGARLG